jgi:hypothetical protein
MLRRYSIRGQRGKDMLWSHARDFVDNTLIFGAS